MKQMIEELHSAEVGDLSFNVSMAEHTTWKIGGPADVFIIPHSISELTQALKILHKHNMPYMNIGRGSNVLISDKGIRGAVIRLGDEFNQHSFDNDLVIAGGAYSFIKLSVMTGKQGLTGLEFAGGIPGTVGGAVFMNAGAHGTDVSQILASAEIVLETGEQVRWTPKDFDFAYRYSKLHDVRGVVVQAVFKLKAGDRKEIAAAMASFKQRRLKTQPLQLACAGSVFRNPEHHYAAKLIQDAGLKGKRIGDAEISSQHANFIVNTGQATAREVLALIEHIQEEVDMKFSIQLVPEVLMVGER